MDQSSAASSRSSNVAANPMQVLLNERVDPDDPLAVYRLIEVGLAPEDVLRLVDAVELLKDKAVLAKVIGMTERTLRHRAKAQRMALTSGQSSKVMRFAEILSKAEEVLGSREAAERWLVKPLFGFEGRTPLDLLSNSFGERMLEDLLTRIEFGVYQ
ncbi:toxin-antitoxin system antitoxin component [Pseudomonas sp. Choline-3u-10]|jgi:putative toxin-antitoxin system antitoxin component (TIGR02293 family)|nr:MULTISPECIES: antitoxin Xre/MbcA/ParS toxin-binding domain-containing protein [Pseudomonadaceae]MAL34771.1 toxin-antitoxin system antitoxin component [Pseudomonas sp.]MBU0948380.1 DUF2384 domain-containing protein [Gammaproteobacteria bacterium]MBK3795303.1 DUF2384 domain-containing protein [Stutzerimonas stutzeri]MBK3878342.1 DUF2384 domain-containing protein [Stutzerimonas stutzeri]PKG95055.1 toxin-antitoxin system antitoxin component [Pseudomonas sp. Choline-3u-10]|tara:strand:- start:688 stop:1158 length:471 start_codon:yes stop_codon:yes gene_type:complete